MVHIVIPDLLLIILIFKYFFFRLSIASLAYFFILKNLSEFFNGNLCFYALTNIPKLNKYYLKIPIDF